MWKFDSTCAACPIATSRVSEGVSNTKLGNKTAGLLHESIAISYKHGLYSHNDTLHFASQPF